MLFLLFFAATCAAAATGALFPTGKWYETLNKPSWVPPNWVFPVAWTTIYLLAAYAGSRVAMIPGNGAAMGFWALQIGLNALWTPVFFGLRHWRASIVTMVFLWVSVLGCLITHFALDTWAGLAFLPYMAWVTAAAALNLSVVRLNPDQKPLAIHEM